MADMKAVKAAAMQRSKGPARKPKYTKEQYIWWLGGTGVMILGSVFMVMVSPDKGPWETPVNEPGLIGQVNQAGGTWKAGSSPAFEGWTIGDVKTLTGVGISQMAGGLQLCPTDPNADIPEDFDARTKWPQCFNAPIYMMGNCTASWAIAAAGSMSNRYCINDPAQHSELILSPQQLLSCDRLNRGCEGGDMDSVFAYLGREGLVSEICFPYQADSSVSCESKCSTESPLKAAGHCLLNGETMIKAELMANGPIVAGLFVSDDLMVYQSGVYERLSTSTPLVTTSVQGKQQLLHAVKVVGWGKMNSRPYWIVENSFGEEWGESGYLKVFGGYSEEDAQKTVLLDTYAFAGVAANAVQQGGGGGGGGGGGVDDDADFEADVDLDDSSDDTDEA